MVTGDTTEMCNMVMEQEFCQLKCKKSALTYYAKFLFESISQDLFCTFKNGPKVLNSVCSCPRPYKERERCLFESNNQPTVLPKLSTLLMTD